MNEQPERADDTWLDRLDEIVEGVDEPSTDDDELLQLARHMHTALAPFRELDAPALAHRQRLKGHLKARLIGQRRSWKRWVFRPLMAAAALLLFILLGPGLVFELNPAGQNNHNSNDVRGWHMPDLPPTASYDILSPTHMPAQLTLLVPTNLVPNAYLLGINTSKDGASTIAQDYLVFEMNALIYESPSPPLPALAFTNSAYQVFYIGKVPVLVTQTTNGDNRLEWYSHGLLGDFVSNLPIEQSLSMVQQLQLVAY